jgi:D-alanine-D-alanine ligase
MRVCVLTADNAASASPFASHDPTPDPAVHAAEHDWHRVTVAKATAAAQIAALAHEGFDVFVNLCDGAAQEDRAGIEVVQALHALGLPFTGAGPQFYEPDRRAMKAGCVRAAIATPPWHLASNLDDVAIAARTLPWPLFVKHPNGYSSVGIGRDACCEDERQLRSVAERTIAQYGAALLESFIGGREFTVLVAEPGQGETMPRVWPPVEIQFPPGERFKHFDLKWLDWRGLGTREVVEPLLAARICSDARAFFVAMGGDGYARCDLRMDAAGQLYMLEINPNCGIFYPTGAYGSADEILVRAAGGHRAFLEHLMQCAIRRARTSGP